MQQNLTSLFASIPAQPRLERPVLRTSGRDRDPSVPAENGDRKHEFSLPADPQDRGRMQDSRRSRADESGRAKAPRDAAPRQDAAPRRDDTPRRSEQPGEPPRRLDPPRGPERASDDTPPRRSDPPGLTNSAAPSPPDTQEITQDSDEPKPSAAADGPATTPAAPTSQAAVQTADEGLAVCGPFNGKGLGAAAVVEPEIVLPQAGPSDNKTGTPDKAKVASKPDTHASQVGQQAAAETLLIGSSAPGAQHAEVETVQPADPTLQATDLKGSGALEEADADGKKDDPEINKDADNSALDAALPTVSASDSQAQGPDVPGGTGLTGADQQQPPASSGQALAAVDSTPVSSAASSSAAARPTPASSAPVISAETKSGPADSAQIADFHEPLQGAENATNDATGQAPSAEKRPDGMAATGARGAAIPLKEIVAQAHPGHPGEFPPTGTPTPAHPTAQAVEAIAGRKSPAQPDPAGPTAADPISAVIPAAQTASPSLAAPAMAMPRIPGLDLPHAAHAASAPIRVVAEVPIGAVPVEIGLKSLAGINHFEIRLDPAELGRIEVRLDIDKDGGVKAHLTVDRLETLALLQRDSRTLERAFEQAGLKPTDGSVDLSLRDPQSGPQSQGQGRHEQGGDQRRDGPRSGNPDMARDDARPASGESPPYRIWRGAAGVDVRI